MNQYISHLLSESWKEQKKRLVEIFWNKCEACGWIESIQCHHGSYSKLWNEPLHHIFLLCYKCHKEYHEKCIIISIQETEHFISKKRWIDKYWNIRRKTLRKSGINTPKTNY